MDEWTGLEGEETSPAHLPNSSLSRGPVATKNPFQMATEPGDWETVVGPGHKEPEWGSGTWQFVCKQVTSWHSVGSRAWENVFSELSLLAEVTGGVVRAILNLRQEDSSMRREGFRALRTLRNTDLPRSHSESEEEMGRGPQCLGSQASHRPGGDIHIMVRSAGAGRRVGIRQL